jgi:RNA polymerase II subunit A small phosphatase-like protein
MSREAANASSPVTPASAHTSMLIADSNDMPITTHNDPTTSTSKDENAQSATSSKKPIRKASQSSLVGRRRVGSVASSRKTGKSPNMGEKTATLQTNNSSTVAVEKSNGRKSGGSRFLSFLSCCGASTKSEDIDLDDQAVPVRVSNKVRSTETTPAKKHDVGDISTGTGDSKDVSVEKIGGPQYSDIKSAGEPKMLEPQDSSLAPQSTTSAGEPPMTATEVPSQKSMSTECENASASPGDMKDNISPSTPSTDHDPMPPTNETMVQATRITESQPSPVPEGEATINDRTPIQEERDTDIEMTDTPTPALPMPTQNPEVAPSSSVPPLPPPPPIAPNRQTSSAGQQDTSLSSQANAPAEQHKWLLPPIRPEFKGKKCLVLDLDETLVHSSFKVSLATLRVTRTLLIITDSPPSRLHHTSRDRGAIPQCLCYKASWC